MASYLDELLGRVDEERHRLADADPARLVPAAREEQARLSARLDGSPLGDDIAPQQGGWTSALKLDTLPTEEIAAVEYGNLLAVYDREPELASRVLSDPLEVLAEIHTTITAGLVARPGQPRTTAQAVHDGGQGRVIYNTPPPEAVAGLMAELERWLRVHGTSDHPVVVAGTVHEGLLEWHPFEAANGRVARVASRLVLRATGVDPHGVAVPERWLAADPAGYYGEVAATIRRRGDLGPWLERHSEAVVAAVEAAADAAHGEQVAVPERARSLIDALAPGETVTVADHAERAGVPVDEARADLRALCRAGLLRVDPGTRGLRYRRPGVHTGGVSTDPSIS